MPTEGQTHDQHGEPAQPAGSRGARFEHRAHDELVSIAVHAHELETVAAVRDELEARRADVLRLAKQHRPDSTMRKDLDRIAARIDACAARVREELRRRDQAPWSAYPLRDVRTLDVDELASELEQLEQRRDGYPTGRTMEEGEQLRRRIDEVRRELERRDDDQRASEADELDALKTKRRELHATLEQLDHDSPEHRDTLAEISRNVGRSAILRRRVARAHITGDAPELEPIAAELEERNHAYGQHEERRRTTFAAITHACTVLEIRDALELARELVECSYCEPLQPFELRELLGRLETERNALHRIADAALEPMTRRAASLRRSATARKHPGSRDDAERRALELEELAESARILNHHRAAILKKTGAAPETIER